MPPNHLSFPVGPGPARLDASSFPTRGWRFVMPVVRSAALNPGWTARPDDLTQAGRHAATPGSGPYSSEMAVTLCTNGAGVAR